LITLKKKKRGSMPSKLLEVVKLQRRKLILGENLMLMKDSSMLLSKVLISTLKKILSLPVKTTQDHFMSLKAH